MKTKILSIALAAVLGVTMLAGCGGGKQDTKKTTSTEDNSLKKVQEQGYFTLGLDADFAPMGFTSENGEIVGFDIDLANAVAEKMGVKAKVKPINWDAKNMELSSGMIDVIWNGFSISDERRKEVLFSQPYLSTKQSIVVAANSPIKSKADLAGKKVALQGGSTSEEALKKDEKTFSAVGENNLARFDENSLVLMEVQSGRADAAVIDEVFVRYYLAKEGMTDKFVVLSDGFDEEDYGVGGRLNDRSLMEAINKALDECKAEGKTSEISKKWFGEDLIK